MEIEKENKREYKQVSQWQLPSCSCGGLVLGGCTVIIVLIALLTYTIFTKPDVLWSRTVDFLNADLQTQEIETEESAFDILAAIYSSLEEDSEIQQVILTEDELTVLARDTYSDLEDLIILVEQDKLKIYWILNQDLVDHPLYAVVEVEKVGNSSEITKFGTERIGFPKLVNQLIMRGINITIDQGNDNQSIEEFFLELINSNDKFQVESLEYMPEELIMNLKSD